MKAREVSVQLDGRAHVLRFDVNAVATYEELTGRTAFNQVEIATFRDLRAILYACLKAYHEARDQPPVLSLTRVGVLMTDPDVMAEVQRAVTRVVRENSPKAEEAGEGAGGPDPLGRTAGEASASAPSTRSDATTSG